MDVEIAVRVLYMLGEAMSVRLLWLLKLNKCISHAIIIIMEVQNDMVYSMTQSFLSLFGGLRFIATVVAMKFW